LRRWLVCVVSSPKAGASRARPVGVYNLTPRNTASREALLRTLTNTEARIRSAELDVGAQATVGEKPFERIKFRGFDQIDVKACSVGSAAVLWPSIARQRHEE
jgi:hypothetical protein